MLQKEPANTWFKTVIAVKDSDHMDEIRRWCKTKFALDSYTVWPSESLNVKHNYTFGFKNRDDFLMFSLTYA